MKVVSGAGEFEINIEQVEIRGTTVVMVGKMGVWEAETFIERDEIGSLILASFSWRLLGWLLMQPFTALTRIFRPESKDNKDRS